MSFGLHGPPGQFLSQTIETNSANKYARCGYTNVTCILVKTTPKHQMVFPKSILFQKSILFKIRHSNISAFMLLCMEIFIYLRATQPNQFLVLPRFPTCSSATTFSATTWTNIRSLTGSLFFIVFNIFLCVLYYAILFFCIYSFLFQYFPTLYVSICFPQHSVEGLLFSWPWACLSSLLDLLFVDPLGKTAAVV